MTRPREQAGELAEALRAEGAKPLELPTIRIDDPLDFGPVDDAIRRLRARRYDWVVFASRNAVERFLARLRHLGEGPSLLAEVKLAAVGKATAAAITDAGLEAALVPERFVAEEAVRALVAVGVAGQRFLLPRGNLAREVLPEGLRAAGALVDTVEVYRTVSEASAGPAELERLVRGEVDVVTFASPSSVRNLAALLNGQMAALRDVTVACVGPVTAEAARELGVAVDVVAEEHTVPGLVAALVRHQERSLQDDVSV